MPANTHLSGAAGCGTCSEDPAPEPRLRFIWPLAAALGVFAATSAGVTYAALEPACETEYRARLDERAATPEVLIEFCAGTSEQTER